MSCHSFIFSIFQNFYTKKPYTSHCLFVDNVEYMAYPQLLVSFYQLFSYPVSTDCPIQILPYNLSTFYFLDPFLYKLPETLHCFIFRLFFSGDHTCLPLIYSIGNGISLISDSFISSNTKSTVTDTPLFAFTIL